MMRRSAGLDPDQARWQLLEKCYDVAPLQLTADDHLAFLVDAMDLKHRFGGERPIVVTACIIASSETWER